MIKLLLDFQWRIDEALDPDPRPLQVIRDFLNFLAHLHLEPVRFVYQQEQGLFWQKLTMRRGGGIGVVLRFLNYVEAQGNGGPNRAIPVNGPHDLRHTWQVALRDEMGDLCNWRTPQIIICSERLSGWEQCVHDYEALIALEDRPCEGPRKRVVVIMHSYDQKQASQYREDYRAHKYTLADIDPWDVRHIYYPTGDGDHYAECKLPRPRCLERIPLNEVDQQLNQLRSRSWPYQGKYWYLPPQQWQAVAAVTKEEWRKGIFPEKATLNPKRAHQRGPVDYSDERVWLWDRHEGHWDVQLADGTHKKINHEGICLG